MQKYLKKSPKIALKIKNKNFKLQFLVSLILLCYLYALYEKYENSIKSFPC